MYVTLKINFYITTERLQYLHAGKSIDLPETNLIKCMRSNGQGTVFSYFTMQIVTPYFKRKVSDNCRLIVLSS